MNTPITKRIHMNATKKNSIAKQTKSSGGILVTDKDGNVYKASADIKPGTKTDAPQSAGSPEFNKAFAEARKAGKENFEFKGKKYNTKLATKKEGKTTPGSVNFNYEQVLTDPTKGTTVDTSNAYGVRQISRGQKKAARDVRRAKIKEARKAGTLTPELRKQFKLEEAQAEKEAMQYTQKRIMDMAKAGVDPRLTVRFESGTEMKAGDPGGKPVIDTSRKYQTKKEFEENAKKKAGINLGEVDSNAGNMVQGDALNKILRKDIDKKENAKINKPVSTAMSNVVSQGYSTSTMFAKKYNKPTSMLKKSCMKMGGFGSKTYKK